MPAPQPMINDTSNNSDPDCNEDVKLKLSENSFQHFNISEKTIAKLVKRNILDLFPIQCKTFEAINGGKDVIAQAKTGSGKTLAFAIPLVEKLQSTKAFVKAAPGRKPRAIVLAPTRELAEQITTDFRSICQNNLKVASIYGGVPYERHESTLQAGLDVVVGTTGRIKDLIEKNTLSLKKIRYVVLDEVDMMLDMGFQEDVEIILGHLYSRGASNNDDNDEDDEIKTNGIKKPPQTLLFSATIPPWVKKIASKYLRSNANEVLFVSLPKTEINKTADSVQHLALMCPLANRAACIADLLQVYCPSSSGRSIVFCETKRDADLLCSHARMSADCHVYHGDLPQEKRSLVMQRFRAGKYRTLVTTNVAARGLDIPAVELVVMCQPPRDAEDYVHRSGRCGRANRPGVCITLFVGSARERLSSLQTAVGVKFRLIGAPTLDQVARASTADCLAQLEAIPESAWQRFDQTAAALEDQLGGARRALCCALAKVYGRTEAEESRSMLSNRTGFTAYRLDSAQPIERKTFAYLTLNQQLNREVTELISHLSFVKDRMALVFDLPSNQDKYVKSSWKDTDSEQLSQMSELPELETVDSNHGGFNSSNSRGRGGSFRGNGFSRGRGSSNGRGGNFNRGVGTGRGTGFNARGRGFKRPFENQNNRSFQNNSAKRICTGDV